MKNEIMKIAMYDLEGHFLEVFETETFAELERELKLPKGSLSASIRRKQLSVNGKQFVKVNSEVMAKIGDVRNVRQGQSYKPVLKYYKGRFINSYQNSILAAIDNDLNASGISRCCSGELKTCGGYEWRFGNGMG